MRNSYRPFPDSGTPYQAKRRDMDCLIDVIQLTWKKTSFSSFVLIGLPTEVSTEASQSYNSRVPKGRQDHSLGVEDSSNSTYGPICRLKVTGFMSLCRRASHGTDHPASAAMRGVHFVMEFCQTPASMQSIHDQPHSTFGVRRRLNNPIAVE